MRINHAWNRVLGLSSLLLIAANGMGQTRAVTTPVDGEVARLFGMEDDLKALRLMDASRGTGAVTLADVVLRQKVSEGFESAVLDVDATIAELSNEQSDLGTVRTRLQAKRDKKVAKLTTAALLTGSALGTAISATQFTALGSHTANVGDGIGVGSGAASTVLSLLAAKAQNGSEDVVGPTPNMLAPLLGEGTPALHTGYPPGVLSFLQEVPEGEDPLRGTRLEQLIQSWGKAGLLQHRAALTTSGNSVKVSIDDLTNRIAMLGDVRSRVSLIKRSLAALRRQSLMQTVSANP